MLKIEDLKPGDLVEHRQWDGVWARARVRAPTKYDLPGWRNLETLDGEYVVTVGQNSIDKGALRRAGLRVSDFKEGDHAEFRHHGGAPWLPVIVTRVMPSYLDISHACGHYFLSIGQTCLDDGCLRKVEKPHDTAESLRAEVEHLTRERNALRQERDQLIAEKAQKSDPVKIVVDTLIELAKNGTSETRLTALRILADLGWGKNPNPLAIQSNLEPR